MSVKIVVTQSFKREAKKLSNRYESFTDDYEDFINGLKIQPLQGSSIGHGVHKVRFAIKSKGKGKRGGARVITHVNVIVDKHEGVFTLLTIYDKSNKETISNKEVLDLLRESGI